MFRDNQSALKQQMKELVKQHIEYDGQLRVEYIYTAPTDAPNNSPCSVVRYSYNGTSNRVDYMKETKGVWLSAWETF